MKNLIVYWGGGQPLRRSPFPNIEDMSSYLPPVITANAHTY